VRQRRAHIFEKDPRGHYVEPLWVSKRLFEVEKFRGPIYDPACGWGFILRSACAAGYEVKGADIVDRKRHCLGGRFEKRDFLTWDGPVSGASVVCNPPFDLVEAFCTHALALGAKKVAMVCLLRRLNAARWLERLSLARVWLLTPRPSMPTGAHIRRVARGEIDENTGKPCKVGGGTQDFVWLVFEREWIGAPRMGWLHREVDDESEHRGERSTRG
jgi:hypothetical protein